MRKVGEDRMDARADKVEGIILHIVRGVGEDRTDTRADKVEREGSYTQ